MRPALLLAPLLILASGAALAQDGRKEGAAGAIPDRPRHAEMSVAKSATEAGIDVAARTAAVRAALAQDYQPSPAIWKLADADTTIYLFGTTHALPESFRWRSAAVDRIIAEADELVLESVDEPGSEAELLAAVLDPSAKRPPLVERVPAAKRDALAAAVARSGLPAPMLDLLPTWLAAFMFGFAELDMMGQEHAFGVETVLEAEFGKAGKPIAAVEDDLAVLASVEALPEPVQRAMLEEAIDGGPGIPDAIAEGDHLWARGEVEAMAADFTPEAMGPEVYAVLLRDRNAAWTEWLEQRLETPGTVLFAVGAGHLVGPDSVQRLLAAKGLDAARIDRPGQRSASTTSSE